MSSISSYRRRVLAAFIGIVTFVCAVPLLASLARDPLVSALMAVLGMGFAAACATLGRRVTAISLRSRRRWLRGRWFRRRSSEERPADPVDTVDQPSTG